MCGAPGCTPILSLIHIFEAIKANSKKVNGTDDIARVGTVSSGDETIGKLIAEAMETVSYTHLVQKEP